MAGANVSLGTRIDGLQALLTARWQELLRHYDVQDKEAGFSQLAALLASWQSSPRAYHTLEHLQESLFLVTAHAQRFEEPEAVALAFFYHDAVYDPHRPDNELRSAQWFWNDWHDRLPGEILDRIGQWILATARHDPSGLNADGLRFLDIDLSILASPPERYGPYAQQIRQEYWHVPDAAYRAGRCAVLQRFLQRPVLFVSDLATPQWTLQAHQNLHAELHALMPA